MKGRFGSEGYAFEELIAELGSVLLMADMGDCRRGPAIKLYCFLAESAEKRQALYFQNCQCSIKSASLFAG